MKARSAAVVVLAALALGAAGCGGGGRPVRVGVLVDCTGAFGGVHDGFLAGAELPFLERGGRLLHRRDGTVAEAVVGGRTVELVDGCTEIGVFDRLIATSRRLVEQRRVDALVGPWGDTDGIVLRDYLRRHQEVTGLLADSTAQAATLRDPSANVFRFTPDGAQASAGLGSYAYRTLGWRTAALVGDGSSFSWEGAAGFVAEFCSLGGRIVGRLQAPFPDSARIASQVSPAADGTVVLLSGLADPVGLFGALARRGPLATTTLTWSGTFLDPRILAAEAPALRGVVMASTVPGDSDPAWRAYQRRFRKAFPDVPLAYAVGAGVDYYEAVGALLTALDRIDGDTSRGQSRLRQELARLALDSPTGRVTLDRNRQAVAPNYLLRLGEDEGHATLATVRVVPGVEQTYSGYLSAAPEPSANRPACRRGPVPRWAR